MSNTTQMIERLMALQQQSDSAITAEQFAHSVYIDTCREMERLGRELVEVTGNRVFMYKGTLYSVNSYGYVKELPFTNVEG